MTTAFPMSEGFIPFHGYKTWYRVVGDLTNIAPGKFPMLALHGGPGVPHDSLEPLEEFARTGRPVILYDQLGCGNSDKPTDDTLWSVNLFLDELSAIRQALGLERIHLLGHSWGGALAMEYALKRPDGLLSLILASAPASRTDFMEGQRRVRERLPTEIRLILEQGWSDNPDFQHAYDYFSSRHVCRIVPSPAFFQCSVENMNVHLNMLMWTGELSDFDIRRRLGDIHVPTLITAGRYDGSSVEQEALLHAGIPDSQVALFEESSHYAHAEEPERYLSVLDEFLSRVELNLAKTRK
ncbi:MAG: proline iminopeptidase-family hydrolase [Ktedonobacteraceae bacterium]